MTEKITLGQRFCLRLFSVDFPGREDFWRQALDAMILEHYEGETPWMHFDVDASLRARERRSGVPVHGTALDEDGVAIHVRLYVKDGFLDELEISREDGRPVRNLPEPEAFVVEANSA